MQPPAHRLPTPAQLDSSRLAREEKDLFFQNLTLVLEHSQDILKCDEYYFCKPQFTFFGVMYSCGILHLGTLLLGWRDGIFIDKCQAICGPRKERFRCGGKAYVFSFGGLASGTGWSGFCTACGGSKFIHDNRLTWERLAFASSAHKQFKDRVEVVEEYPINKYSFGSEPMVPDVKSRKVTRMLVKAASVAQLVEELKSGDIRTPTRKDQSLLDEFLIVKRFDKETGRIKLLD